MIFWVNVALNRTFVTGLPVAHPSYKMGPVFRSGTNRTLARPARAQDIIVCVE